MSKRSSLLLFIALAVVQISVLCHMVWKWENILQSGQQYYWQTAPIDPYDALKGRYVQLNFATPEVPLPEGESLKVGQTAYATLTQDASGFASISHISSYPPAEAAYVLVKITAAYHKQNNQPVVRYALPFNRYYMREDLAPSAEVAYRKSAGKNGTVAVRIKSGYGVIEELYIGQETIYEYLQREQKIR